MPEGNEPNGTPAAPDPAGQQPTTTTPTPADPSQTPAASEGQQTPPDPNIQNPAAKAAAEEAARYRREWREAQKALAELQEEKRKAEEAKLSETERLQKRLAEYQAKEAQTTLATQERILRAEVRAEAIARGLNPALAARLVDYAEVAFDDETGDPTNIGALLDKAITEYGIPANAGASPSQSQQQQQASAQTPNPGGTNPQRAGGPLTITANQYLDQAFRKDYAAKNGMDLMRAITTGKVKIV